jgi:hypothetical protein
VTAQIAATTSEVSGKRISVSTVAIHGIFGIADASKTVSQ